MFVYIRSVSCLVVTIALAVLASAQPPAAPAFERDREDVAAGDVPKSNEINIVTRLILSPDQENVLRTDADKAIVDKVLKYYLYRLTWEEVQKERDPARVGTIDTIMTDIIGHAETNPPLLPRPFSGRADDQDMVQMRIRQLANVHQMTPIFVKHCRVLLQNRNPIVRINAARILAKLADWGQEVVVDELASIIANPKESDAVRNYAFNGLTEIFSLQGSSGDIRAKGLFQDKAGQARLNKALLATYNWLLASTRVPEAKLQYMHQEEQAGLRFVRRAAERALGASHRPLVVDERASGKQEGPIAELLVKIVAADVSIVPAPDLRERLEASLALMELQGDASSSYQPDYAAHQIGDFLTKLGAQANSDKDNKAAVIAWKLEAHKLKLALNAFAKQRTSGPATGYLAGFASKVDNLLVFMDDTDKNTDAVKSLSDWLRDTPLPSKQIYKEPGQK